MQTTRITVFAVVFLVSLALTRKAPAQRASARDSLGLRALNESLTLVRDDLSLELTFGQLKAAEPDMEPLGVGLGYLAWGTRSRADRVTATFLFRSDSGEPLAERYSARAPLVSIESETNHSQAESFRLQWSRFDTAIRTLGPPDFCVRDTMVADHLQSIVISNGALWLRDSARVLFNVSLNLRDLPPEHLRFLRRFSLRFRAEDTRDPFTRHPVPEGHASPCIFTEGEILEHAVPLDSAAYHTLRATLLRRPPKEPPVPDFPDRHGPPQPRGPSPLALSAHSPPRHPVADLPAPP